MPAGAKQTVRFGPFILDEQCGQLRKDGLGLKLQGQPIQILEILLENPGQLVTREELRQRLWDSDTFVDFDHSLNTAIKKLRQTLGDEADTPRYIETLPRRGYRFIGEVVRDGAEPEVRERAAVTVLPVKQAEPWPEHRVGRGPRILVASLAALLFSAIAVAAYFILKPEPQPRIVGAHVLTKTANRKDRIDLPFIDRGFVYFFDAQPTGGVQAAVPVEGGEVSIRLEPGFFRDVSRDGSKSVSMALKPDTTEWDAWTQTLPSGAPRLTIKDVTDVLWSADGRSLFFDRWNRPGLYRANADGTAVEQLAGWSYHTQGAMHMSPDGRHIRFSSPEPTYRLLDIRTDGSDLHELLGGRNDVLGGGWSPDGNYYFFTSWDGDRWSLWAVSEGRHWWKTALESQPHPLTFGPMSFGAPAISSDGKHLYAVGKEPHGELSVYDPKARKFVPYLEGISVCFVDFSRDGKWIAYVNYPEGTLWRSRIDGSERRQLTVPPLAVMNPRWSPDGKLIAFTDMSNGDRRQMNDASPRRTYVISADGGGPELLLAGRFQDPTWSPDGNSIAYDYNGAQPGSAIRILNLKTQKSITVPGSQGLRSPRWSPDGKYLVALRGWLSTTLMLFSFATNAWVELATSDGFGSFGWPSWSMDSGFVYAQDGDSLVRVAISDHKKEQIASLQGFRATAYYFDRWDVGWFGLTPDDRPLSTRDTGIEEIYAFDLEYK